MRPRRRTPRVRRDRDGGYLLLEALATLALSALVLGGLLALGGGLSRAVDRAAFRLEAAETGRRTVAAIGDEIARLSRRRYKVDELRFAFLGEPDRIVFVREAVQPNGLAQPVAVAYQAPGPGEALRAEGEFPIAAVGLDAIAFSQPRRLDVGAETLRFAYVARLDDGAELVTDSWGQPGALPLAVRIDRVDPKTGRTVASRRIAIVSQTEPGCAAPDAAPCSTAKKTEEGGASTTGPQQGRQPAPLPEQGGQR